MDGVNLTKWFLHARGQFVIGLDDGDDDVGGAGTVKDDGGGDDLDEYILQLLIKLWTANSFCFTLLLERLKRQKEGIWKV